MQPGKRSRLLRVAPSYLIFCEVHTVYLKGTNLLVGWPCTSGTYLLPGYIPRYPIIRRCIDPGSGERSELWWCHAQKVSGRL